MDLNSISTQEQEEIEVLILINSQIFQDGRKPVNVFCLKCKTRVETQIKYEKNKEAEAILKFRFWGVVLFVTVLIITFIIWGAVVGPTAEDKFILIGFGILALALTVGGIYYFVTWLDANHGFENAFHFCPHCKKRLGYSDGNHRWQMYI
jgi:hypothetical protein